MIQKIKSRLNTNIAVETLVGLLVAYFCWSANGLIQDVQGAVSSHNQRISTLEQKGAAAYTEQQLIRGWLVRVEDKLDRVIERKK